MKGMDSLKSPKASGPARLSLSFKDAGVDETPAINSSKINDS